MPEAVIVSAARTPIGRANKGSLKDFRPDDLAAFAIQSALDKIPALDPTTIEDLYLGCGLPGGESGNNMARIVTTLMGLEVPGATTTRYCASSVQTTRMAFHAIKAGEGDIFVSAGVETVSRFAKGTSDHWPDTKNPVFAEAQERTNKTAELGNAAGAWHDPREDGLVPDVYIAMGQTAENVATLRGLDRKELDEYAVEQALQLKEKAGDDTEVTALCIGPEKAVDAVRKALQMGADKGILVSDEAIAGSDYLGTSLVLAEAIKKIGVPDLVMCGMASTDASGSVVPAMLAERLDLPQVTFASVIETQGDQVRIKRDGDTATEVIGATMPLVMSVTDQTGEARYPSFKGIMAAKKKPLETWSLSDLGVDAELVGLGASWSAVEETAARPPRTAGEIVTDEDGSGATALTEFLASKKFI